MQKAAFTFAIAIAAGHAQTIPSAAAKEPDPVTETAGIANGRYWRAMSEAQRRFYLRGLVEATLSLCLVLDSGKEHPLCKGLHDALYSDVDEQITKLYADPANLSIPVSILLPVAFQRLAGLPDEETSERILFLRRAVADSNSRSRITPGPPHQTPNHLPPEE